MCVVWTWQASSFKNARDQRAVYARTCRLNCCIPLLDRDAATVARPIRTLTDYQTPGILSIRNKCSKPSLVLIFAPCTLQGAANIRVIIRVAALMARITLTNAWCARARNTARAQAWACARADMLCGLIIMRAIIALSVRLS